MKVVSDKRFEVKNLIIIILAYLNIENIFLYTASFEITLLCTLILFYSLPLKIVIYNQLRGTANIIYILYSLIRYFNDDLSSLYSRYL